MLAFVLPNLLAAIENDPTAYRQGSLLQMMTMLFILAVPFYFLMWRPEKQRRQLLQNSRNAMKKGDRVYAAGIVGLVQEIKEETVILKMVDGHQIEVLKVAISDIFPS